MKFTALTAAALLAAAPAFAGGPDDDALVINGDVEMVSKADAPAHLDGALGDKVISGWHYRTNETQALELDDFDNPGMIFVDQALDQFEVVEGAAGKSCASCHEDIESFAGLTAEMPKVNEAGELVVMEDLVNTCRTERMEAEPWKWSGAEMQGMIAAIAHQSRGMPMNVAIDGPAQEYWEQGKEMYYTRYGQLELSCASCHEDNNGNYIRADHLSQGQINGFPTYRLKQAKLISKHNRFRGCIRDTRAETFAEGSDEFRALELYVASRGNGLSVETPAVRQ
ncbi:MAG: sulfur oxidation c-type cytochrome SoxA [Marinovum algicola]|uniref:SoxAX cytochrome complex subunit A n=1 Tax=Marinovum algicola TaxID=42444 RepID=A0A975ZQP0_9RHOB|nr:sulfur oxidation c-type cytochrome SoxA [Marinovum algicola]AKO98626.1 sulfur oxidation protein SoxA [Marinovum algicola DG 898]SEK07967.1 diheme cytochrome SoxA (sulfur oxidation) [Marinovum algicola]SLN36472.1 SoxAX cytochrome complex subunit A precursor [Marinovum algicola]